MNEKPAQTSAPTPAVEKRPLEDWRQHPEVLAALGKVKLLEPTQPRLGVASPMKVADWAHACGRAWKRWSPEESVSMDDYIDGVEEAVGLPIGGHAPAGGHKPDASTPEAIAAAVPPGPKHGPDLNNPVSPPAAPMRPAV